MSINLKSILEEPFLPMHNFKPKTQTNFRIKMENFYLNSMGRVYKLQKIKSVYTREIEEVYEDAIMYASYKWKNATFEKRIPKEKPLKSDWNFIKGKEFRSHVILSNERLHEISTANDLDISREDYKNCFDSIEEEYSTLPKLPSTYLVIMQTFDIIAFETYLSYIHSHSYTNNGWKLDEWVTIDSPELDHSDATSIGLGIYSENSHFKNGKFKIRFTGYGKANNQSCAIFDYYCDYSQVRMENKSISSIQRNGTSYYHGQVWINLNTGDLQRGTMLESYIALQEGSTQTPMNIRRRVLCEAMESEAASGDN